MRTAWGPAESGPRRVAVTGLGVVATCGIGKEAFWAGLMAPQQPGERRVRDFDPEAWLGPKEARRVDRFAQFNLAAAQLAVEDAGHPTPDPERAGVVMGAGIGGVGSYEESHRQMLEKGPRRVSPFVVPMMMANAGAAHVSMRQGWRGPCETVVTACASGTHAIGYGARLVASGRCQAVLAGGAEAAITPMGLAGFGNMTALSPKGVSRPFDASRDGFVIAEGAAVLVLEDLEEARSRGARVLAEVAGAASTADAYHITAPSPDGSGALRCMEMALEDAGIGPAEVGHINAHGTSTPLNDLAEAQAINKLFGAPGPPVTSVKGVCGHALAAAGAIEAVAAVLSIDRAQIPPTDGLERPDPEIHLDLVAGGPRPWEPGPVLSNSFGFGGHNACLVIVPPPRDG
ncbi:MAG TPA: beta-ketoacyl-ACP synthase II [Acidimicrobiales bacterium]|jgi:3-oxoacyl-[acyl-carrier-protein] synthase II|nr:beta-ketoacyl-ACP synthase II [Acidimicrobiales bacterium]